jgi:RHS repeat-associated protein
MLRFPLARRVHALVHAALLTPLLLACPLQASVATETDTGERRGEERAARRPSAATWHAPTILDLVHVGDYLDMSKCEIDCFETTFGYTTPAYISRDVPRAVSILYRSGRAKPLGKLTLNVLDANAAAGSSFRLQLTDANGSFITFSNGSTSVFFAKNTDPAVIPLGGSTRIAAHFDASGLPTGARLYTAYVTSVEPNGTLAGTSSVSLRIITLNEMNSPYGAGVDLVGVQRIHSAQPGGVLVTDGSGSASFFAGSCSPSTPCTFTAPAADFSVLSTGGGQYKRTYPDGTVVTFNSSGDQVSVADRFLNTTQILWTWNPTYDRNVPASILDPIGQGISFTYRDANNAAGYKIGSLGVITSAGNRYTYLGVDPSTNDLKVVAEHNGQWFAALGYDTHHRLTSKQDKNWGMWYYGYPHIHTRAPSYLDAPEVRIVTGAKFTARTSFVEPSAPVLQAAAAGGGTSHGAAIAAATDFRERITDSRGNTTYLIVNRFGSVARIEAPLTNQVNILFDTYTGQLKRTISPTGARVRYNWIGNQLRQIIDSATGKTVNIDYSTQYSLPIRIYGSVAEQLFTYDQSKTGWPLQTSRVGSSSATPTTYGFDAYGRPTWVSDPSGHTTQYGYQTTGLQNRSTVTAPNGQVTVDSLDTFGRLAGSRDPYGMQTSMSYDMLNRVRWTARGYNDTTKFQYDSLDNITSVTDAKGQVYTYQRNVRGWIKRSIYPSALGDSIAYDSAGSPAYIRTRQNREVRLTYDALGRVIKKASGTGGDTVTYAYDTPGSRWVAARTVRGGVLVSTDTIFTDSIGRTLKEQTVRPGGAWSVTSYYNGMDPGRTSVAVYKAGMPSPENSYSFLYDAQKRLSMIQLATGHQTTFSYNTDQLLDSIGHTPALGQRLYYTSSHALAQRLYNVVGVQSAFNRSYRTDSLARLVERAQGTAGQFQLFTYDLKGRLTYWTKKTQTTTPSCVNLGGWGYDCSATSATTTQVITALHDQVENPDEAGATVTAGNRLTAFAGASMTYDLDGYLTSKGAYTYTWDSFGQLTSVSQSGTVVATFAYDGFGRRITKTSSAGTVQYVWDGDQLVLEADANGTTTQAYSYYPGIDRPHSVSAGGQTYYTSIEPATGDVNGLIRASDNAVVAQYAYTPWGAFDAPDQALINGVRVNSLRWKGLVYDTETGLYYMRARYYDPQLRRFIAEDPIGLAGGINLYAFAGGDPVNGSDPSGLDPVNNGFNQCWKRDYSVTWGNSEPVMHWVQVECPSSPLPSQPQWGPAYQGPPMGPTGQTTGGGIDYGKLASTAGRKLLACSDKVAGVALSAMGAGGFYKSLRLTYGFINSGRATKALMAVKKSGYHTRQLARRLHNEQYAAKLAGGSALLSVAGSPALGFHDALFSNAEDAAELIGGFIPGVSLVMSAMDLRECLVTK